MPLMALQSPRRTWSCADRVISSAPASMACRPCGWPTFTATGICCRRSRPVWNNSSRMTRSWTGRRTGRSGQPCIPDMARFSTRSEFRRCQEISCSFGKSIEQGAPETSHAQRIISGTARGTHLIAPKGEATRPTADRAKEALFSIINQQLPAAGFLDIFSGTGQIGLEAASRGARPVVLIEKSAAALTAIRTNLARTHLESQVTIMGGEAAACLRQLASQQRQFASYFYGSALQVRSGRLYQACFLAGAAAGTGRLDDSGT
jgi:hypothetical protein